MSCDSSSSAFMGPIESDNLVTLALALQAFGSPSLPMLNELLFHAIRHNAVNTIPYLVSLGAFPPLDPSVDVEYASSSWLSLQCLVKFGLLDINLNLESLGTFIILAVRRSDKSHMEFCLQHGADANQSTYAS